MRNANEELFTTMNTCLFCTRSWAAVLFAPPDWSSTISTLILRPFTPPAAFWRSTRDWQPLSALRNVDPATPVLEKM